MKEQEISLQAAKLAKLKGFDWECRGYYKPKSRFKDNLQEHFGKYNSNKKQTYIDENGIEQIAEMYSAPTQGLLQKWLRSKKILVDIFPIDSWESWHYNIFMEDAMSPFFKTSDCTIEYNSYEQALEVALLEALNLL